MCWRRLLGQGPSGFRLKLETSPSDIDLANEYRYQLRTQDQLLSQSLANDRNPYTQSLFRPSGANMRPKRICSRYLLSQSWLAGLGSANEVQHPSSTCPALVLAASSASSSTCPSYFYAGNLQSGLWARGDVCQSLGSTELCSFTNPSFNGGFGLSLITSPQRLDELLLMPSLTQPTIKRPFSQATQSYHDEVIPGKGIGLVASGPIAAGELILARTPAVLVDEDGFGGLGEGPLKQLLVQAIGALPHEHRTQYMNLSTHDDVNSYDERVYQVFAKNNYRTRITNTSDFHAAFVDGMFAHQLSYWASA